MSAFVLRFSRRLSRILPNLNEVSRGSDQYSELIRELLTKKKRKKQKIKEGKVAFCIDLHTPLPNDVQAAAVAAVVTLAGTAKQFIALPDQLLVVG